MRYEEGALSSRATLRGAELTRPDDATTLRLCVFTCSFSLAVSSSASSLALSASSASAAARCAVAACSRSASSRNLSVSSFMR